MQSDAASILQSGNLYMYVMHNPVAWVDPSGEIAIPIGIGVNIGKVIGAVISGGSKAAAPVVSSSAPNVIATAGASAAASTASSNSGARPSLSNVSNILGSVVGANPGVSPGIYGFGSSSVTGTNTQHWNPSSDLGTLRVLEDMAGGFGGVAQNPHVVGGNILTPSGVDILTADKSQNQRRDSGLSHLDDAEIAKGARDKSLSGQERQRYQREEKVRGQRNQQKRNQ